MVLRKLENSYVEKKFRLGSGTDKNKAITIVQKQSVRKDLYWFMVKHNRPVE